jgi:isopentenyl-diphosphate delta-isomerase
MNEQVVLIDSNDNIIGYTDKLAAHKEPLLHRAFTVFIYDSDGHILIHQRAYHKYHSGGHWSTPCCGHPRPGESYEGAAHRKLKEEMGFDCDLREIFKGVHNVQLRNDGLYEHEYGIAFGGRVNRFSVSIDFNPDEIADVAWIYVGDLLSDVVATPHKYTFWFRFMLDTCVDYMLSDPAVTIEEHSFPSIEHKLSKEEGDWIVIGFNTGLGSVHCTDDETLKRLMERTKPYYEASPGAHGWDHIERVRYYAHMIGIGMTSVDMQIVDAMVLLHDIVRHENECENENVSQSVATARMLLGDVGYSSKQIEAIVHGIRSHSLSSSQRAEPETVEARILFDADKLDAIGIVGIARWLMTIGKMPMYPTEAAWLYLKKLSEEAMLRPGGFYTERGRDLSTQCRYQAKTFFETLLTALQPVAAGDGVLKSRKF